MLKGIQTSLALPTDSMLPSFATLCEYGEPRGHLCIELGLD